MCFNWIDLLISFNLDLQLFKGKFFHCKDKEYSEVVSKQDCIDQGSSWVNKEYNFDNLAKVCETHILTYIHWTFR